MGTLSDDLKADAARYAGGWHRWPGFWVVAAYRVRRRAGRSRGWRRWAGKPLSLLARVVAWAASDAELPPAAEIGPGLFLPHPSGIVVSHRARIGPGVTIFQQVTLGETGSGDRSAPTVGAGAELFAGAKVLGGVRVGAGARVGANAVVLVDVPDGALAIGVPARVLARGPAPAAGG